MITNNDLFDLTGVLMRLRDDITNSQNEAIVVSIKNVLINHHDNLKDNQIRIAVSSVKDLDQLKWGFVFHNNVYLDRRILKDEKIYLLLITVFSELEKLFHQQKGDQAYDLLDAIHCLPTIIVDNGFKIPRKYWRTYLQPYRNKWDKSFLTKGYN